VFCSPFLLALRFLFLLLLPPSSPGSFLAEAPVPDAEVCTWTFSYTNKLLFSDKSTIWKIIRKRCQRKRCCQTAKKTRYRKIETHDPKEFGLFMDHLASRSARWRQCWCLPTLLKNCRHLCLYVHSELKWPNSCRNHHNSIVVWCHPSKLLYNTSLESTISATHLCLLMRRTTALFLGSLSDG